MKRRNPRFGCRKIAEQVSRAFAVEINKDIVRRILIQHYRPVPGGDGPAWLTVIGHAKDSLWSVDFFRCESILLKSYWVMVVMDVFTRRIMNSHRTEGELTLWGIRSLGLASILVMLASSAHRSWRKTFCGHSALVTMEYTTLGKTGLRVSVAGLCRKRSTQRTSRCIRVARGGGCAEGPSLNGTYRRTARHLPSSRAIWMWARRCKIQAFAGCRFSKPNPSVLRSEGSPGRLAAVRKSSRRPPGRDRRDEIWRVSALTGRSTVAPTLATAERACAAHVGARSDRRDHPCSHF